MCGLRNNQNTILAKKLALPSHVEGDGIAGDILMSGTEFAIQKGVPSLAKKAVGAGRFYASEALRNKKLNRKPSTVG